jgi:hypothetical protein
MLVEQPGRDRLDFDQMMEQRIWILSLKQRAATTATPAPIRGGPVNAALLRSNTQARRWRAAWRRCGISANPLH